jgi:hypothetical protein
MPTRRRGLDSPRVDSATFQAVHSTVCDARLPPAGPLIIRIDVGSFHRNAYPAIHLGSLNADSTVCKGIHSAACEGHRPPYGSRREQHDDARDHRYATRRARRRASAWARTGAYDRVVRTCVGKQYVGAGAKRLRRTRESASDDRRERYSAVA